MSMIIGRKQVILAVLVLALGTAIFLNWRFSGSNGLNIAGVFNGTSTLGAASYVDNQNVGTTSAIAKYFATARLSRQQAVDQAEQELKTQVSNTAATAANKQSAETAIEAVAKNMTNEAAIENLIKAKGFSDCMAYISEDGTVSVVVPAKTGSTLTDSDLAQVDDIVIRQTKVNIGNIKIIQAK